MRATVTVVRLRQVIARAVLLRALLSARLRRARNLLKKRARNLIFLFYAFFLTAKAAYQALQNQPNAKEIIQVRRKSICMHWLSSVNFLFKKKKKKLEMSKNLLIRYIFSCPYFAICLAKSVNVIV